MNYTYPIAVIAVIALVTAALRFMPFLISGGRETLPVLTYLGKVLPFAIMGMLVVYCMKNVSLLNLPFGLPEIIAGGAVALLHLWKRNTLISIASGTVIYMLLIQFVFV